MAMFFAQARVLTRPFPFGTWVRLLVLALLAVQGLAACGASTTIVGGPPPPSARRLTFAQPTSYTQALREVTDRGLQPGKPCGTVVIENITYTGIWQPEAQQDTYTATHQLYTFFTETSLYHEDYSPGALPPDVIGVAYVAPLPPMTTPTTATQKERGYFCSYVVGTPPAGTPELWTAGDDWLSTTVTFTSPLDIYDAALSTVSNLGLGLDAACYPSGPVGQEQTFAATHTLRVQTDRGLTSTTWLKQLRSTAGVLSVAPPSQHPSC